jgi:hypothetical protein
MPGDAMAMPFDTLRLARRLEAAGFAPQQAGGMAEAIAEAISGLATKADLLALKADLQAEIVSLRAELEILKRDMTIRLGSMMVVAVGVILAGFKLIH